jgi:hypothetical protein
MMSRTRESGCNPLAEVVQQRSWALMSELTGDSGIHLRLGEEPQELLQSEGNMFGLDGTSMSRSSG